MILYETPLPPHLHNQPYAAIDTETELIKKDVYVNKTRIKPPHVPRLVLGSIAYNGKVHVLSPRALVKEIRQLRANRVPFVFHNTAFDIAVLLRFSPSLKQSICQHIQDAYVYDTGLRDMLLKIAGGSLRTADFIIKYPRLADLARKLCSLNLEKGPERTDFGRFRNKLKDIPEAHLKYAALDAHATLAVFCAQQPRMERMHRAHQNLLFPSLPNAKESFGFLGEHIQVKGFIALNWFEQFPLRVDLSAADERHREVQAEVAEFENRLVDYGLARVGPKTKKFTLSHKTLRKVLTEYAAHRGIVPPYSDTGLLSLEDRFWAQHIPTYTYDTAQEAEDPANLEARLSVWLRYARLRKLLTTYLQVYASSPEHYPRYRAIGARTTRTACSSPNIQQIPKRRDGIRNLFVAQPDHLLIEADFQAAELVALAQVFHLMYKGSKLGEALNHGHDPHLATVKRIVGRTRYASLTKDESSRLRYLAKAANFGFPGGLGAGKFAMYCRRNFGLDVSERDARRFKAQIMRADPALRAYLRSNQSPSELLETAARNLNQSLEDLLDQLDTDHVGVACARLRDWKRGCDDYKIQIPPGFHREMDLFREPSRTLSGAIRGNCLYSEARNFPFQAAVADLSKLSLWNLYCAWTETSPWRPVAFVHDSIMIESHKDHTEKATQVLRDAMEAALKVMFPDIRSGIDISEPSFRWGAATDAEGNKK